MKRIQITQEEFMSLDDENLFQLLTDLQNTTEQLMLEGWRRKLHGQLSLHAMSFKAEQYKAVKDDGKIQ